MDSTLNLPSAPAQNPAGSCFAASHSSPFATLPAAAGGVTGPAPGATSVIARRLPVTMVGAPAVRMGNTTPDHTDPNRPAGYGRVSATSAVAPGATSIDAVRSSGGL